MPAAHLVKNFLKCERTVRSLCERVEGMGECDMKWGLLRCVREGKRGRCGGERRDEWPQKCPVVLIRWGGELETRGTMAKKQPCFAKKCSTFAQKFPCFQRVPPILRRAVLDFAPEVEHLSSDERVLSFILLSGKLQNATNSLSAMPINRRCGLLFGKVSPPFRLSFIGCPLKRENGRHEMWPNVFFKPLRALEYGEFY